MMPRWLTVMWGALRRIASSSCPNLPAQWVVVNQGTPVRILADTPYSLLKELGIHPKISRMITMRKEYTTWYITVSEREGND